MLVVAIARVRKHVKHVEEDNLKYYYLCIMSLNDNIQKWVFYNNKIKELQSEITDLRKKKTIEEQTIITTEEENKLLNNNIKTECGIIKFCNSNKYTPLTLQYIGNCLCDIIEDKEQVSFILNYIKDSRTVSQKMNIKFLDSI